MWSDNFTSQFFVEYFLEAHIIWSWDAPLLSPPQKTIRIILAYVQYVLDTKLNLCDDL